MPYLLMIYCFKFRNAILIFKTGTQKNVELSKNFQIVRKMFSFKLWIMDTVKSPLDQMCVIRLGQMLAKPLGPSQASRKDRDYRLWITCWRWQWNPSHLHWFLLRTGTFPGNSQAHWKMQYSWSVGAANTLRKQWWLSKHERTKYDSHE